MPNCPRDRTEMQQAGSTLTKDGAQLLTTYLCPKCFHRVTERQGNPRYVPMMREQESIREAEEKRRRDLYLKREGLA